MTLSAFLFALLLFKRARRLQDNVLMIWLAAVTMHIGLTYLQFTGLAYRYPHLLGLTLSLPVLHAPFPYLYTLSWMRPQGVRGKVIGLHLVPFILLTLLALPFFLLPPEQKLVVFQRAGAGFEWYMTIQLSMIIVSGLGYTVATIRVLSKARLDLKVDPRAVMMLRYVTMGMGGIWLLSAAFDDAVIFAGVALFVLFLGGYGISQIPELYGNVAIAFSGVTPPVPLPTERYVKTGLAEGNAVHLMQRIDDLMQTQKLYTQFNLTLDDLAGSLKVTPNHLSQAINSVSGKNFYQYLNHYRIAEFLLMAEKEERQKYTFLGLAYDCGFNSKTTFNKYFKLHTGKTPSEYFNSQDEAVSRPT